MKKQVVLDGKTDLLEKDSEIDTSCIRIERSPHQGLGLPLDAPIAKVMCFSNWILWLVYISQRMKDSLSIQRTSPFVDWGVWILLWCETAELHMILSLPSNSQCPCLLLRKEGHRKVCVSCPDMAPRSMYSLRGLKTVWGSYH